jgi:hypothetical protein
MCDSADIRRFPELVHRSLLLAIAVPKCLKRNIHSDFVAKLEAVCDCLGRLKTADLSSIRENSYILPGHVEWDSPMIRFSHGILDKKDLGGLADFRHSE